MNARRMEQTLQEVSSGKAARILKLSTDTVARLCERGLLRARRSGLRGWWRIQHASVIEYRDRMRNY